MQYMIHSIIIALLGLVSLNLVQVPSSKSFYIAVPSIYSLNIFKSFITINNQRFIVTDEQVASMIKQLLILTKSLCTQVKDVQV